VSAPLPKAAGGAAALFGSALGDALGRSVDGLGPTTASLKIAQADAAVGFVQPGPFETDVMREALPGTPSAATMRALALVEAALLGPEDAEAAVEDALRRVGQLGFPAHPRTPFGALIAPSPSLRACLKNYSNGISPLSCGAEVPDSSLLTAAVALGAAGVALPRAALLLRATTRDPVSLCAALTLAEVTRVASSGGASAGDLIKLARGAEEQAFEVLKTLPGSLAKPPEMGHGALAMSLARAQSASNAVDALMELTHDASHAPDIVLGSVLAAVVTESEAIQRNVATVLRLGGASSSACSTLLGLSGALLGLKVVPMGWLQTMVESAPLLAFSEAAATGKRTSRLPFPAADLCWQWGREERTFREGREVMRRTLPPPPRDEQLKLL